MRRAAGRFARSWSDAHPQESASGKRGCQKIGLHPGGNLLAKVATGGATGAAVGTTIGSVVPVAGNLVGGIVGFIVGAAAWVGVDYGILVIDEKRNCEEKESKIINDLQKRKQQMLGEVLSGELL